MGSQAACVTQIVAVDLCSLLFVSQDSLILQLGMARVKLNQQQPGCQVVPRPRAQSAAFISTGHPRTKTFLLGVF